MLRHPNIDYNRGVFFVTIQAAFNKTLFGAIVGNKCALNELGQAVHETLSTLGTRYPGIAMDEFVVMPNHVHFIIAVGGAGAKIGVAGVPVRPSAKSATSMMPLGEAIGRIKGWIAKVYRDMRDAGKVADVGTTPLQRDYWEKLIADKERLEAYRRYIRMNPAKWTRDRFGAVTTHVLGNVALLNARLVGFVASQGEAQAELKPRLLWRKGERAQRPATPTGALPWPATPTGALPRPATTTGESLLPATPNQKDPLISTFTSAQERLVLKQALNAKRRIVMVCPGGIPQKLDPQISAMCEEGKALLISPVPPDTGVNKQRAVWCNEYILRHAAEVWAGSINPGRTLDMLIKSIRPR